LYWAVSRWGDTVGPAIAPVKHRRPTLESVGCAPEPERERARGLPRARRTFSLV